MPVTSPLDDLASRVASEPTGPSPDIPGPSPDIPGPSTREDTRSRYSDDARPEPLRRYDRGMTEYQITYWREVPSLVVARDGDDVTKAPLPSRFQEAIDEAAMRLGDVSSDAYLAGWRREDWASADGSPVAVADSVVTRLEAEWTPERIGSFIDGLETSAGSGATQ
jgi:Virulence factor